MFKNLIKICCIYLEVFKVKFMVKKWLFWIYIVNLYCFSFILKYNFNYVNYMLILKLSCIFLLDVRGVKRL